MKKVGYSLYVHKSNIIELIENIDQELYFLLEFILATAEFKGIRYEIVKVNKKSNTISLIDSSNWNTANEPTVGDSYCFKMDRTHKVIKGGSKVYHNKWQFVSNDYTGFDVERAKERTIEWNSIPNIKDHKSRIGNKDYWYSLLRANGLSK